MTSIRKAKKVLKREIRRIDKRIISQDATDSCDMWDLYLYRNFFKRKLNGLKGNGRRTIIPDFDIDTTQKKFRNVIIGLFAPKEINNPTIHEEVDKALEKMKNLRDYD